MRVMPITNDQFWRLFDGGCTIFFWIDGGRSVRYCLLVVAFLGSKGNAKFSILCKDFVIESKKTKDKPSQACPSQNYAT